jgi:hypothetical protein
MTPTPHPIHHPEVRAAERAFTRVFDALWRRASKGDGPGRSSFEGRFAAASG